jgi:hypothetical protein
LHGALHGEMEGFARGAIAGLNGQAVDDGGVELFDRPDGTVWKPK